MPETIDYSVVMAIHTLWLAARAEGIGVGWVSILDATRVAAILETPPKWTFIGYLCVGYPLEQDRRRCSNAKVGKSGARRLIPSSIANQAIATSIRTGPLVCFSASRMAGAKSLACSTRRPGTPCPSAMVTKSISGNCVPTTRSI